MNPELHNRTRRSASIARSLLKRGRIADLPVYYVLQLSDLAREGVAHSGSHRFADHIYRNQPSGRGAIGRWLDARLLALPAARSFRSRYLAARDEVARVVVERVRRGDDRMVAVLSVPCGIPRELADAAAMAATQLGGLPDRVEFHGLDLDPDALADAGAFAEARGFRAFRPHLGDALDSRSYPQQLACITSTGLAEFLADDDVIRLYRCCFDALEAGGVLVTSAMLPRRLSEYLLRLAEIRTHYRSRDDLVRLARRLPFRNVQASTDSVGLQTILIATK
jgi:SAM-dependent methyltransferase